SSDGGPFRRHPGQSRNLVPRAARPVACDPGFRRDDGGGPVSDLTELGVKAIRDGVAAGDFTAREVAEAFNAAVAAAAKLNAFIGATPEKALEAAEKVDADRAAGKPLGEMAGVPIGMKDLFATKGVQTTAASHILEGFVPQYESTVSQK